MVLESGRQPLLENGEQRLVIAVTRSCQQQTMKNEKQALNVC